MVKKIVCGVGRLSKLMLLRHSLGLWVLILLENTVRKESEISKFIITCLTA